MTDQHPYTPTKNQVGYAYVRWNASKAPNDALWYEYHRMIAQVRQEAEQRGAAKALRDAADYLAENKQVVIDGDEYTACNSCTVIQYEYLTYRADQMEGDE